jgi:hypothetical protein
MAQHQSFPQAGMPHALIAAIQRMPFAAACANDHLLAFNFLHDPVLLDFIHVFFAVAGGSDVLCPRAGSGAAFGFAKDDPVARSKWPLQKFTDQCSRLLGSPNVQVRLYAGLHALS